MIFDTCLVGERKRIEDNTQIILVLNEITIEKLLNESFNNCLIIHSIHTLEVYFLIKQ